MGQIITTLYVYLKSVCPPCIQYDIDLSSNTISPSIIDISSNDVSICDNLAPTLVPTLVPSIPVIYPLISNPILPPIDIKQSLDEILKKRYNIPHKKAVCLMEEFHTLDAIMKLTVQQISECKCNERKIGSLGATIWKQLHP